MTFNTPNQTTTGWGCAEFLVSVFHNFHSSMLFCHDYIHSMNISSLWSFPVYCRIIQHKFIIISLRSLIPLSSGLCRWKLWAESPEEDVQVQSFGPLPWKCGVEPLRPGCCQHGRSKNRSKVLLLLPCHTFSQSASCCPQIHQDYSPLFRLSLL